MKIIKELLEEQSKLDQAIYQNSAVEWKWKSIDNALRIKLNILVETGELSNEIKTFKILRRGVLSFEKAREELIDVFCFFLGLVNIFEINCNIFTFRSKRNKDFNKSLLELFNITNKLLKNNISERDFILKKINTNNYKKWFSTFNTLLLLLDMNLFDLKEIYLKKNKINYERLYREKNTT